MRHSRRRRLEVAESALCDVLSRWLRLEDRDLGPAEAVHQAHRLLRSGELERAEILLRAILERDHHFRPAYAVYAALAMQQRCWPNARQALVQAQREEEQTREWILLAQVEHRRGDVPASGIAARRAARSATTAGELVACGLCALEVGQHRLADQLFSTAIERAPGNEPVADLGRAVAAYRLGNLDDSARWLTIGARHLHPADLLVGVPSLRGP